MTQWYSITPAGTVAIGNLTPVGQNSGQVGCRWPPNGHQLAACLNLPTKPIKLWGPFWHWQDLPYEIFLPLPQTTYRLADEPPDQLPQKIFRLQWRQGKWNKRENHDDKAIEMIGGQYLISGSIFQSFWQDGKYSYPDLQELPWQSLTLSHNRRENYRVKDEGGFFAERTTLLNPGWSILVKILGDYEPPRWSYLGAGSTPVSIAPVQVTDNWLTEPCSKPTGAVLLTAALWDRSEEKISLPYPYSLKGIKGYAAEARVPWQSLKKVKDRHDKNKEVVVLTPGEWMTPAGAVYLWQEEAPLSVSQPLPDPPDREKKYHRDALGYGHLWLFTEKIEEE